MGVVKLRYFCTVIGWGRQSLILERQRGRVGPWACLTILIKVQNYTESTPPIQYTMTTDCAQSRSCGSADLQGNAAEQNPNLCFVLTAMERAENILEPELYKPDWTAQKNASPYTQYKRVRAPVLRGQCDIVYYACFGKFVKNVKVVNLRPACGRLLSTPRYPAIVQAATLMLCLCTLVVLVQGY